MNSFFNKRVSPPVIISIFFGVIIIGLLVGWFILQAMSVHDQLDACAGQGGTVFEKPSYSSCPSGDVQLWENQNIYCCIALGG